MKNDTPERRSAPRQQPVDLEAVILSGMPDELREVRVRSLSTGGVALEVNIEDEIPFSVPLGTRLTLSFLLPAVAQIACVQAEVVRTYRQLTDAAEEEDTARRVYGLGLQFIELTAEVQDRLQQYMRQVMPPETPPA